MKVQSNSIVFVDITDTTKMDIHIASNNPTAQIYDINTGTYTPDWSKNNLELIPTVYADGLNVTDKLDNFRWVKIYGAETEEHDIASTDRVENKKLIITGNELSQDIGTIRYRFYATYNSKTFTNDIAFALTITGRDGYTPQKGVDYFDGVNGKNGTSVNIKGTAYARNTPVTGSSIDLYSDTETTKPITSVSTGDSYLVDGYLCVYSPTDGKFVCVGKIQGEKGAPGDSSFLFVRYADDQYGNGMDDEPAGKTYIGFYRTSVNVAPTQPSQIKDWIKFVGSSASLVTITPSSLYFKSTTGKDGVFTPEFIYLYPRFQVVTYDKWQYSVDGGITWTNITSETNGLTVGTYNAVPNSLRISRTSALYADDITSISFRCLSSNNTIYDTVSVAKIYDVVDLKIGGRNLARYTDSTNWINHTNAYVSFSDGTRSQRIKASCNTTDESEDAIFGIQQKDAARLMKLKPNQEYTLSFMVRGNVGNFSASRIIHPGSVNQNVDNIEVSNISETDFVKVYKTFTARNDVDFSTGSYIMISYKGPIDPSLWFEIEEVQLEAGQIATDWSMAPEDILDSAANVNVMLSNEAHFFEADSSGVPTATSVILDVVGFKGSIQSPTKIGAISGLPSSGMTATSTAIRTGTRAISAGSG
jgi:hypothetical protein